MRGKESSRKTEHDVILYELGDWRNWNKKLQTDGLLELLLIGHM